MSLKTVFHGVDQSIPAVVLEGATRPFYLTPEIKSELCQHFGYDPNQPIILFDALGKVVTQDHLFQCSTEYCVAQLQGSLLDCPPCEITTSWKLKPKISLQGSSLPSSINSSHFSAKVRLLTSSGEDVADAFCDEDGKTLSEISKTFTHQGIASFCFKILVSSLTKGKTKKGAKSKINTNTTDATSNITSKGLPTQFYLQFFVVTTNSLQSPTTPSQSGNCSTVNLLSLLSEAISVFPHSKYIQAAPKIEKVIPDFGPANTESDVAIHGQRFVGPTIVFFGGFPSPAPALLRGDQALECLTPKCPAGEVTVKVFTCGRGSQESKTFRFIEQSPYNPNGFILLPLPSNNPSGYTQNQAAWPLLFNCLTGMTPPSSSASSSSTSMYLPTLATTNLSTSDSGNSIAPTSAIMSKFFWENQPLNELCNGWAFIHYASAFGHLELTKILILSGANVNLIGSDGLTPLWWAVFCNHSEMVDLLLSFGADPNIHSPFDKDIIIHPDECDNISYGGGLYPIHISIMNEQDKIYNSLVTAGARLDVVDQNGSTVLHYACCNKVERGVETGGQRILASLLEQDQLKIDINITNNRNETPLHWAVAHNEHHNAQSLISRGALTNVPNQHGLTPAHFFTHSHLPFTRDDCNDDPTDHQFNINVDLKDEHDSDNEGDPSIDDILKSNLVSSNPPNFQPVEESTGVNSSVKNREFIPAVLSRSALRDLVLPLIDHLEERVQSTLKSTVDSSSLSKSLPSGFSPSHLFNSWMTNSFLETNDKNMPLLYNISARVNLSEVTLGASTNYSKKNIAQMIHYLKVEGTSETEIDSLSDLGALVTPERIGSWISFDDENIHRGGWEFPVDMPLKFGLEMSNPSHVIGVWAAQHKITRCQSVRRDSLSVPPYNLSNIVLRLDPQSPPGKWLELVSSFLQHFQFPEIPSHHRELLDSLFDEKMTGLEHLYLSITTQKSFVSRLGLLIPSPPKEFSKDLINQVYEVGNSENVEISQVAKFLAFLDQNQPVKFLEYLCHNTSLKKETRDNHRRNIDVTVHFEYRVQG